MGDPRLVIVRRGHFATFELLTRTFADDPTVQIVWDRRREERREPTDLAGDAGRRQSYERRRVPPMQWGQLNYLITSEVTRQQ